MSYDDVVIGGGSAGSTLAARLTEDSNRQVLLLEAGAAFTGPTPADELHGINFALTQRDWGVSAIAAPDRVMEYSQGKAFGGGSAVNGGLFMRGMPADYDGWAAQGSDEWSWEKLLPAMRRLEADQQYGATDIHGGDGPIPVTRWGADDLIPLQQAFLSAVTGLGFGWSDDFNDPTSTGIGPFPMNRIGDLRVSTAIGYLAPASERDNLTIWPDTRVIRIRVDGGRVTGVDVERDGRVETVAADRVVLCGGAVQSPTLLWRSGIGPAVALRSLGIDCIVDNPAVGSNLMEHPGSFLFVVPRDGVCDPTGPQYQIGLRYTAPGSEVVNDTLLSMMNFWDLSTSPDFQRLLGVPMVFAVTCGVHQPRSRGSVTLTSADPSVPPHIDLNLLSDPGDVAQLVDAVRLCHQVVTSPAMSSMVDRIALVESSMFDDDDDDAVAAYVRSTVAPWYHVSGTCRMGRSIESGAVVDQHLRVHGVEGLRVVDASVFPMIPRAPTNLTTIAVAERAVELGL